VALSHIPTLHGVDPFQLQWSAESIAMAAGVDLTGYSITAPPLPQSTENPREALVSVEPDYGALRKLGTSYIVTRAPLDSNEVVRVASDNALYIYRLVEPGRFHCGDGPNRLHMALGEAPDGASSAIVHQAWAPGWTAWIDGKAIPVERDETGLMRVRLPARQVTRLELVYRPLADIAGMAISGITAFALLGVCLARRRGWRLDA
jgi:hypothetical protein